MANKGDADWFEEDGKAGQEDGKKALGEELVVEDDEPEHINAVVQEVPPTEPTNGELKTKEEPAPKRVRFQIPEAGGTRAPAWAKVPKDMKFPRGIQVLFFRVRGELTMYPSKGDRHFAVWALTDGDEKLAIGRSMANAARAGTEMAKQMVRAVDGQKINWTGDPNSPGIDIDRVWHEIGPKGRNLLQRLFTQLHAMNEEETTDFFENCIGVVSTG